MNALCKLLLGVRGVMTKMGKRPSSRPKMGKKLTNLNRYISVITDIDENWFVIMEHTINLGYVCVSQGEYDFSCFASFFLLFFFF